MHDPPPSRSSQQRSIGTFVLVLFGCGVAVMTERRPASATGARLRPDDHVHGLRARPHLRRPLQPGRHLGAAIGGRIAWREDRPLHRRAVVGASSARWCCWSWPWASTASRPSTSTRRSAPTATATGATATPCGPPAGRAADDGGVRVRDPVGDRRPQRAPGAGSARDRPRARDDPLRADPGDRHLGQPGPLARRRAVRRRRRDHQVWLFIIAPLIGGRDRRPRLPAPVRPRHRAGGRLRLQLRRPRRPPPRGTRPDQYQQQWNQPVAGDAPGAAAGYPLRTRAPTRHRTQAEQPIIQDGWQWDPQAQQWIPAQQPPPAAGPASRPPEGGSEATQVRPPDA